MASSDAGEPRRRHRACASALITIGGALAVATTAPACRKEDPPPPPPRRANSQPDAISLPPRAGPSPVRFVDATAESGVAFEEVNGYGAGGWYYVETFGSGVVLFDADGDGDPDLYFCNGRRFTGPDQEPPPRDAFFRNERGADGKLRFVDATGAAGLGDAHHSLGACAADYDNDGDLDLYVCNFDERNVLYRNDGTGRFTDVAAAAGVAGRPDGVDGVCAFADVDGDGWLDLYVGGCCDHTRTKNKPCHDAPYGQRDHRDQHVRRYCNPVTFEPLPDLLYRNRGDGTFEDFTQRAGIAELRGRTLGLAFCDFDDDGDQDLFVACDRSANLYLVNDGKGRFTEQAAEAGVALDADGHAQGGMGTAVGDYDEDGRMDLAVTYFEKEPNGLYRNLGGNVFEDRAQASGTGHPSFLPIGWGTELFDADLDGHLDWLVMNGHVQPHNDLLRPPDAHAGTSQFPLFFLNRGDGRFEELGAQAGPALEARHRGRGLATGDLDGDGDLDLALNDNTAPAVIWRNDSPRGANHWLVVRTVGAHGPEAPGGGSNRDGVGARIVAHAGGRKLLREIHTAQSFFSQGDLPAHFGLGPAARVDLLEVRWPSGRTSRLEHVAADQLIEITEPPAR